MNFTDFAIQSNFPFLSVSVSWCDLPIMNMRFEGRIR